PSTSLCSTRSCCSLFDIEAYEFEVVALLSGLVYGISTEISLTRALTGVPEVNFLCDFVCGYLLHTRSVNCRFLCLVFRNFPSEWMTIWNCMMNITEHVSVDYLDFPKNASGRPTLSPEESTFRTNKFNEVVATAGVKPIGIRPELMLHRIESVLRWLLIANPTYVGMSIEFCHFAMLMLVVCMTFQETLCYFVHCAQFCTSVYMQITTQTFPALLMDGIFLVDRKQKGHLLVLLKRLLLDDGAEVRGWISAYIKRQNGCDSHVAKLNEYFIKYSAELIPMDRDEPLTDEAMLSALALLRVIAALRGFANYTFPPVLSSQLLDLLTHKTVQTERGSHYTIYALAFLIGLRTSLSLEMACRFTGIELGAPRMIATHAARVPITRSLSRRLSTHLPIQCILQLLQSHAFAKNRLEIKASVCNGRYDAPLKSRSLYQQSTYRDGMYCWVPPSYGSSKRFVDSVIYTSFANASFNRHYLLCYHQEWIIGQIYESVCPMHPLLPDLVEAHIMHSFGTTSVCGESTALISECELLSVFSPTGKFAIAQLCTPAADVDQDCTVNWDSHTDQWCAGSTMQPDLTPALLFLYYALFVYDYQLTTRLATSRRKFP
ncbi:uncharacterized protein DEA37_0008304, partial [Paragonimus westermani]